MPTPDDELDRFLDGLAKEPAAEPPGLDDSTVLTVRILFQRAAAISPSPGFVNQLERAIVGSAHAPDTRSGAARRATQPGYMRVWFGRAFGAAALAAIAMIAMVIVYSSGPDDPNFAVASVAASPGAYPARSECNRDPVPDYAGRVAITKAFGTPILATIPTVFRSAPVPNAPSVAVIPISSLPAGDEPGAGIRAAVAIAVRREFACRNFSLYGWAKFLIGGNEPATPNPDATPTAGANQPAVVSPLPVPANLQMTEFTDGRVGVLLSKDMEGSGLEAYAIYAPYQNDWFMTEYNVVASDAWIASTYRGAPVADDIAVHLEDTYFWPQELAIPRGQPVNVIVTNEGSKTHTLTSSNSALHASLKAGERTTLKLTDSEIKTFFQVDIDPSSNLPRGGYIWAIGADATPTVAPIPWSCNSNETFLGAAQNDGIERDFGQDREGSSLAGGSRR